MDSKYQTHEQIDKARREDYQETKGSKFPRIKPEDLMSDLIEEDINAMRRGY